MNLPKQYLSEMKELLKDEYDDYISSFDSPRSLGLRVNTGKISVEDFLKIAPFKLEPIPWTSDGFYYKEEDMPSKHPYYYAGLYYLQEPSAMLPAEALPIEEGDIVLDACAAPGGKSSKLANKLNNTGVLFSNDISVSRAQILLKTLENQGIANAYVMAEDIMNLDRFNGYFDKILVDAPCSGEGMFRKEPELIRSWMERGSDYYAPLQKAILDKAVALLKDGGNVLYSTCTFSPKEDEEVIEYALDRHPELKLIPISQDGCFAHGISERTKDCLRLYPHRLKGEGHFVALLQKGNRTDKRNIKDNIASIPDIPFLKDVKMDFKNGRFVERKGRYTFEPLIDIDLKGLRMLRSGLYLGDINHDRFEPSIALALSSKKDEFSNVIDLDIDDPRVLKYLKCETLDVKDFNIEGTVLVCVDGYPLGFGKVKDGILKNRYPANYRYR